MLEEIGTTTTRAPIAAVTGLLVIGAVAVAWADSAPSTKVDLASVQGDDDRPDTTSTFTSTTTSIPRPVPPPTAPVTSTPSGIPPAPVDISGNCDEAEHANDPECRGVVPVPPTTTATTMPPATTTPPTTTPSTQTRSFAAGDAGTVTYQVDGRMFTLISAAPAAGWRVEVERASGFELDLDFRSGSVRVQVDVEFEDGGVRERVRIRDDADDSRTEIENGEVTDRR